MDESDVPDEWYTIEQVADILEIPPTTVRQAIKAGRLKTWTVTLGKTKYRVDRSEIERVIRESGGHRRQWYRLQQAHDKHWGKQ